MTQARRDAELFKVGLRNETEEKKEKWMDTANEVPDHIGVIISEKKKSIIFDGGWLSGDNSHQRQRYERED